MADEDGAVSLGRLLVQIIERPNRPPRRQPESRTIFGPGVPTSFDVLANAIDPDNTPGEMTVVSGRPWCRATARVSLNGRVVTITPNPNFVGSDRRHVHDRGRRRA